MIDRRGFIRTSGMLAAASATRLQPLANALVQDQSNKFNLRIEPVKVDLGHNVQIQTLGYNGSVSSPALRMRENSLVQVEVTNATNHAASVHWQGLYVPSNIESFEEQNTSLIPAGHVTRHSFITSPSGSSWYHTHTMTPRKLAPASFTEQFGFLYIEPKNSPGDYDHEVFLAAHHWNASFTKVNDTMQDYPRIFYEYASFNDKMLKAGSPLKVKKGDRVLFHFLNASATEDVAISLPHHKFKVLALDGNPVATPSEVNVLSLGIAERVDAIVEMDQPGKWILGSTNDSEREKGLGLVVEYAGVGGDAVWQPPAKFDWHYKLFSNTNHPSPDLDGHIEMIIEKKKLHKDETDTWTINGMSFQDIPPLKVKQNGRYRLRFINASGCPHPIHFHRHTFELKRVQETKIAGVYKDVVNLPRYGVVDVELIANQPGANLFHGQQPFHMNRGFMQLLDYV